MEREEKQLKQALERIAELNRELGRDPGSDDFYRSLTDPLELAASRLTSVIKKSISTVKRYPEGARTSMELHKRLVEKASPDELQEKMKWLTLETREYEEKQEIADEHLGALTTKLELLQSAPNEVFLPLGTHVRLNGKGRYRTIEAHGRTAEPQKGTEGVVVRLNSDSDYPIAVAVIGKYVTADGTEMNSWEDRPHVVHYDRDHLDVVAPALLPDGSEFTGFGLLPTHTDENDFDDETPIYMMLESNGHWWQFREHTYERGRIEALKAFNSLDQLPDLVPFNPESSQLKR